MTRRRLISLVVAVFAIAFSDGRVSTAGDDGYQADRAPRSARHRASTATFLRDVFLKKATRPDGETVHPIELAPKFRCASGSSREVIRKTPAQLKSYWNQQIFSGKGVPPPDAESAAAVITYVVAHPGAIGFIPTSTNPGGARVVQVK